FFQADDGIRDRNVTGVQTCALPICIICILSSLRKPEELFKLFIERYAQNQGELCRGIKSARFDAAYGIARNAHHLRKLRLRPARSEERRVGKELKTGGLSGV